jgi:hypothetical protein
MSKTKELFESEREKEMQESIFNSVNKITDCYKNIYSLTQTICEDSKNQKTKTK